MSTKIFPHIPPRTYSASKNIQTTSTPDPDPAADLARTAQREAQEQAEKDRQARAFKRAQLRAKLRAESDHDVPAIRSVTDYLFRFFSTDVLMVNSLISSLDGKMPKAKVMRRLSPIITPWITEPQQHCVLCAAPFQPKGVESAYPCIIISARPKPPHKRPPTEPICICNHCFADKRGLDSIESLLFAYAKLADPDIDLGISGEAIAINLARCKLYALRRARRIALEVSDLEEVIKE